MTTERKFKSDAFEAIHSSASALRGVGVIDEDSLREFDMACVAESDTVGTKHVEKIHEQES